MASLDPMERLIEEARTQAGLNFTMEDRNSGRPSQDGDISLDFHLVDVDIYIEVKQFYSERTGRQLAQAENVIVAQGRRAVELLAGAIRAGAFGKRTDDEHI